MTANTMPSKQAVLPPLTRRGALSLASFMAVQATLPANAQERTSPPNAAPADSATRHRFKVGGTDAVRPAMRETSAALRSSIGISSPLSIVRSRVEIGAAT